MTRIMTAALVCLGLTTMVSCGDNQFTGGNGNRKNIKLDQTGGTGGKTNGGVPIPSEGTGQQPASDGLDPDDANDMAVRKCLKAFGNHPFGTDEIKNYRKIHATVQVLGVGKGIVDDTITNEPALILIGASVSVLGQTVHKLLNPNGWYCLRTDVNVQSNTNIELHCRAHLADSKVDVSVLSNSQPAGQVGVNVLSNVSITRVGSNCQ